MTRRIQLFSLVLLAIFIGCAVLQFLSAGDIRALMLNTDALNIPTVVDNIISQGGSLSNWYLSPAPYLFPDALLHAIIHPFAESVYVRLAAFAALQIVLLFVVLWNLAIRTHRNHPIIIAVTITGTLTWMSVLRGGPYDQLMTAGFHYGAFLISILIVTLGLSNTTSYKRWCGIAILCFFTSLSDNIIVIQTTIPLALTLTLIALFDAEHRTHRLITAGVAAFSSLLGSLSYGLLITHDTRYPIEFNVNKFRVNADGVRDVLVDFLQDHHFVSAAMLMCVVLAIHYFIRLTQRLRRTTPIAILSIFVFASTVCTSIGLLLATTNEMTIRYFLPVFSWPIIFCGLIIFNIEIFGGKFPVIVSTISALLFSFNTANLIDANGIDRTFYPPDIACIDNALSSTTAVHGMANYWDAKYIQVFSKRNIVLAQHWDVLAPMKWITTQDYYRDTYDFAIISTNASPPFTLSQDLIVKTYGEPQTSTTCGTRIVLVFQQGE